MNDTPAPAAALLPSHGNHLQIAPGAIYFGGALTLVSTLSPDGSPLVRPFSASFTVGTTLLLGLNGDSSTRRNLVRVGDCVVNVPQVELAPAISSYSSARTTGCADGFKSMGLTPLASERVRTPRVRECYLQLESRLVRMHRSPRIDAAWAELAVLRIHAVSDILVQGSHRIDAAKWKPLVYSFAHLFGLAETKH